MKRRDFLQAVASAPLLTGFASTVFSNTATSRRSTLESWRIGMSIAGYQDNSFNHIAPLREAGFDCIQLSLPFSKWSDSQTIQWLSDFKAACDAKKLGIEYVHVPFSGSFDISLTDAVKRQKVLDDVLKLMDWNQYIQAAIFVIHPSSEPISDEDRPARIGHCVESLRYLRAEAKKRNILLVVENLPRTCLMNTSTETNEILAQVGDNMPLCFDTNHLLQEKPEDFLANVKGAIAALHIADYDFIDERHWLPFEGKSDWKAIIDHLIKRQYRGTFMFESIRFQDGTTASFADAMARWERIKRFYNAG